MSAIVRVNAAKPAIAPAAPAAEAPKPANAAPKVAADAYTPAAGRSPLAAQVDATREQLGRSISAGIRQTVDKLKQGAVWAGAGLGGAALGTGAFFGTIAAVEFTIGPVAGQTLMLVATPWATFGAVLLGGWLAKRGLEKLLLGR